MCVAFLVLARMFASGILDFCAHKMHKICNLVSLLIRLGPTWALMILDWSAFLVEATAVTCVVTLEWAPMLLAEDTVLVSPSHFLGFFWDPGVNGLHLALPFSPFWLVWVGRLWIKIGIVLDVLQHQ